jgi:hypothetical protein
MHFRRARRQRSGDRLLTAFAKSILGSRLWSRSRHKLVSHPVDVSRFQTGSDSWSISISRSKLNLYAQRSSHSAKAISQFHSIRDRQVSYLNEEQLLKLYLDSQEDPYIRESIVAYCASTNVFPHITESYLERIAKLKLFL